MKRGLLKYICSEALVLENSTRFAELENAYLLMLALGAILPGLRSVVYGFNFLLGVMAATLIKAVMQLLKKWELSSANIPIIFS